MEEDNNDLNVINGKRKNLKRSCTILTALLNDNFKEIVTSLSENEFLTKLPSVVQEKKNVGKNLYAIYTSVLQKNLEQAWIKECEERDLQSKLNILDNIIQQNSQKSNAWRPETGNIEDQLLPSIMNEMKEYKDSLEQEVNKLEADCDHLKKEVLANRTYTKNILTLYENFENKNDEPASKKCKYSC